MKIVTRLKNNGDFLVNGYLDEVTHNAVKVTDGIVYSSQFDEVTINPLNNGIAKRETATGQILVAQELDEVNKPT